MLEDFQLIDHVIMDPIASTDHIDTSIVLTFDMFIIHTEAFTTTLVFGLRIPTTNIVWGIETTFISTGFTGSLQDRTVTMLWIITHTMFTMVIAIDTPPKIDVIIS
jgi:hypothetical protein